MDGVLSIYQSIAESVKLPVLVDALAEHQSFQQEATQRIDPLVAHITALLSGNTKKYEGLLLLQSLLEQCSLEVIEQKGQIWLSSLIKICALKKPETLVPLAYNTIEKLLCKSKHVPELFKSITSNYLSKILETIRQVPVECHFSALKCIGTCMLMFPGPSGSSRQTLEKFIYSCVDNANSDVVVEVGKCLQLLQQVRGGALHGISQKDAWSQLQTEIIASLHSLLNQIYENAYETIESGQIDLCLKLEPLNLSADPVTRTSQLVHRFNNLCTILGVVLTEPFPSSKLVQPSQLLQLIARGLGVTCKSLNKNAIVDNIAVGLLLPSLHEHLFVLLQEMIVLLRFNLLIFMRPILDLFTQNLTSTSSGRSNGLCRPFRSLRMKIFETITLWCDSLKYASGVESIAAVVIGQILQDATPYQSEVTLKVMAGGKKHMSKKARRRLQVAQNEATNLSQTHATAHNLREVLSDVENIDLCETALKSLIAIMRSADCLLKPSLHKTVCDNIVAFALSVTESRISPQCMYSSASCRAALLETLLALVSCAHSLCPPPVQIVLAVLSKASTKDNDSHVRVTAWSCLRSMEAIMHPKKETLVFPNDIADIKTALTTKDQHQNGHEEENDSDAVSADGDDKDDGDVMLIEDENKTKRATVAESVTKPEENITLNIDDDNNADNKAEAKNTNKMDSDLTEPQEVHNISSDEGDDDIIIEPQVDKVDRVDTVDRIEQLKVPETTPAVINLTNDGDISQEPVAKKSKLITDIPNIDQLEMAFNEMSDSFVDELNETIVL